MKISRLCLLAASLAAVLTVTGCDDKKTATPAAQASAAKTYNIGVVQLVEHQRLTLPTRALSTASHPRVS